MRQCPKCGEVDPIYWRHPAVFPDIDYTHFEDFKTMNPDLAAIIRPSERRNPHYIEDRLHVYWMSTTKKWVYRIWKPIFNAFADTGTFTPISQMRKNKFYDSKGRVDKEAYARLFRAIFSIGILHSKPQLSQLKRQTSHPGTSFNANSFSPFTVPIFPQPGQ